jgi:DNA-binding MarR family transcriptional regulator
MPVSSPHKPLNDKQLALLDSLYRFRFIISTQISKHLGLSKTAINNRLSLLSEQEFIGRRYDSSYNLRGQPASYHLLSKGAAVLKNVPSKKYQSSVLKNMYKDASASDAFITHCLAVLDLYCGLSAAKYGDDLHAFTKSELAPFSYFPKPLPDLFVRIKRNDHERQYFIDYLRAGTMTFLAKRRVNQYLEYAESGEWEQHVSSYPLPSIILVCADEKLARSMQRYANAQLGEYADDDLAIQAITTDLLPAALAEMPHPSKV